MESLVDEDGMFWFSGEPSKLEYYRCYDDSSNNDWINGKELLKLEKDKSWLRDTELRKRWLYFYRPYNYRNMIGRPQKEEKERLNDYYDLLSSKKNKLSLINFFFLVVFFTCVFLPLFYSFNIWFCLLPLVPCFFSFIKIISVNNSLKETEESIYFLDKEIDCLVKQKEDAQSCRATSDEIEAMFWHDVRELEEESLNKAAQDIPKNLKKNTRNYYKHIRTILPKNIAFPMFPVVPSWALLQEQKKGESQPNDMSGLMIAYGKIGRKVASWRNIHGKKPIFRLWYIQHLFFHSKNITIVSYYYDFITRKKYSEHIEIYQYNHITNYSFIDEDISFMVNNSFIKELCIPVDVRKTIFGNEIKTISLQSSSGSSYRCVLPDTDVENGLNDWIRYKQVKRDLLQEEDDDELPEADRKYANDLKKELFVNKKKRESEIESLAWRSFIELREKVAKFAISDSSHS